MRNILRALLKFLAVVLFLALFAGLMFVAFQFGSSKYDERTVVMPEVTGTTAPKALSKLHSQGFKKEVIAIVDLTGEPVNKNDVAGWKVCSQSPAAGFESTSELHVELVATSGNC